MKAYVVTTGAIFALLTLAHLARILAEGSHLATDPFFVLVTLDLCGNVPLGLARVQALCTDVTARRLAFLGVLLGVGFGIWNLLSSLLDPLAEDTIPALLMFYGPMFASWSAIAFFAARRTGRVADGIKAGAIVAFVTFLVFDVMVILRVNIFLHDLTGRLDWQNLMLRFHASGSESLRTFINYHYVTGAPFKIFVATVIGAVTGAIGGVLARADLKVGTTSVA